LGHYASTPWENERKTREKGEWAKENSHERRKA
jgi:hypothetical protein